jgi:outer membrane protein assembly factor BamE (lipoprotein component of BamABCDE complex)
MLTKTNKIYSIRVSPARIIVFLLFIFCVFVLTANAQNSNKKNLPVWQSYKGISIGMTADEVRTKLGAAKSEDDQGFFYIFSETENAQFLLDNNKKVRTVSVVFTAESTVAPKFPDVFGNTAELEAKPDGSIYKMVKYMDAGYWVSYSRMAGERAMVIVMIQKMLAEF